VQIIPPPCNTKSSFPAAKIFPGNGINQVTAEFPFYACYNSGLLSPALHSLGNLAGWHNLFIISIPLHHIMKLILLLIAIYTLIFYQQYKIQKAKPSLPESEFKTVKADQGAGLTDKQDYKTANYLIPDSDSTSGERKIAAVGFYQ
jgi:hypothetical protein